METKDTVLMEINADEQFMKNYQAIYYAMNAKPDCKSKLFQRDVKVTLNDLKVLNRKVTDKFKAHYDDAGFRININVSLKNKEYLEFDSWMTFESYDFSIETAISSILLVWEYNAKLPGYALPQRHTLTVRIADEIRMEEMLNLVVSGKLEEVDKIEQEVCPIVARVDFINSILGDELLRIVDQWQEGLEAPMVNLSKLYKLLKNCSRIIAYAINYITTIVFTLCMLKLVNKTIIDSGIKTINEMQVSTVTHLISIVVYSILSCIIIYKLSQLIANVVFVKLRSNDENHIFDISSGDRKLCQELEKKINRNSISVAWNLFFTFVFNVVCSVFANHIS